MAMNVYKMTCLTNLHMGSGDVNYSVIDLEVERDPVLGEPTMNATGIKGALRDACEKVFDEATVNAVFGDTSTGTYKFFQGDLIARPIRVSEGNGSYTLATTKEMVDSFTSKLCAFGIGWLKEEAPLPDLNENEETVLCKKDFKSVEGLPAEQADCTILDKLIGDNWTLMRQKQLVDIDLPVQAHNVLDASGTSTNLWYEENVPHKSIFYMIVSYPDGEESCIIDKLLEKQPVIQFGAGATTGNGYIQMLKVGGETV